MLWGGHLATITSRAQNELARSFSDADCWIGYSDQAAEGSWVWADGTATAYSNWGHTWYEQQPDNCCAGEDCAFLSGTGAESTHGLPSGTWGDVDCSQTWVYGNGLGAAFVKGYVCSRAAAPPDPPQGEPLGTQVDDE